MHGLPLRGVSELMLDHEERIAIKDLLAVLVSVSRSDRSYAVKDGLSLLGLFSTARRPSPSPALLL